MALALTSIRLPRTNPVSLGAVARFVALVIETRRQRRALANLDANACRDLGLTHEQIKLELARPVWDVPQNWLR